MQAIILAGGLGTRLRSVVSDRPKPMALVEGKPFLEYVLQGLKKSGIDDIIFAVGYKGGMVEEYFGDGSRFGIRARYAYEEELLGTAGAIKNAGKYVTDEQFFVLNGDTFYQMDFGDLSRVQQEKNLEMALVLRVKIALTVFYILLRNIFKRRCDVFMEMTPILTVQEEYTDTDKVRHVFPVIINSQLGKFLRLLFFLADDLLQQMPRCLGTVTVGMDPRFFNIIQILIYKILANLPQLSLDRRIMIRDRSQFLPGNARRVKVFLFDPIFS